MSKFYKVTAVDEEGEGYKHFGIHELTANVYGYKKEDIIELEMIISDDQERPEPNNIPDHVDYWGWIPKGRDNFSLIYRQFFLLNMCFPSGIKATEEALQGRAYRIEIKK